MVRWEALKDRTKRLQKARAAAKFKVLVAVYLRFLDTFYVQQRARRDRGLGGREVSFISSYPSGTWTGMNSIPRSRRSDHKR